MQWSVLIGFALVFSAQYLFEYPLFDCREV